MNMISIGDLARSVMLQRHTTEARANMNALLGTLSSGVHQDLGKSVGGDFTLLASIEASLSRLSGWEANARLLDARLTAQQAALQGIDATASDVTSKLLVAVSAQSVTGLTTSGASALAGFSTVVWLLNTRMGEEFVFSGQASDSPSLIAPEAILAQLTTEIAGAVTADEIVLRVEHWFSSPAGFAALAYRGGAEKTGVGLSEGTRVSSGPTALDPGLRKTLEGMALGALLGSGALAGQHQGRSALAQFTAEKLISGQVPRTDLSAMVGIGEQSLREALVRQGAEKSGLEIARAGIVSADPYETALELREAEARLESVYTLTARLSRLTLVEYLR